MGLIRSAFGQELVVKDVQWLVDLANRLEIDQPVRIQGVKQRAIVSKNVRNCHRCPLRQEDETPVPIAGPTFPDFVVVGEAPGRNEMEEGEPFVGKSGQLLKALFSSAGIERDDVAYMNVVSCWPRERGKTLAPHFKDQLACRSHFQYQLASAYTKYVLLVGVTALHSFREDLALVRVTGKVMIGGEGLVMMAIPHPAGMLQSPDKEVIKKDTIRCLKGWSEIVKGADVGQWIMSTCAVCGDPADQWDEDAIGYCPEHWESNKGKRNKARVKWRGSGGYGQETIF